MPGGITTTPTTTSSCPGWFALAQDEPPWTHYQLLGISPSEQDRAVIEEATLARMAQVRAYQVTYPEECTRLLNDIAHAFLTLLDPGQRAQYDAGLSKVPAWKGAVGLLPVPGARLTRAGVRAVDQEALHQTINRGLRGLCRLQQPDGTWPHAQVGATALAGLALLECGVGPDDPAVEKAARVLRQATIRVTASCSLSLSILFLDRLGERRD